MDYRRTAVTKLDMPEEADAHLRETVEQFSYCANIVSNAEGGSGERGVAYSTKRGVSAERLRDPVKRIDYSDWTIIKSVKSEILLPPKRNFKYGVRFSLQRCAHPIRTLSLDFLADSRLSRLYRIKESGFIESPN